MKRFPFVLTVFVTLLASLLLPASTSRLERVEAAIRAHSEVAATREGRLMLFDEVWETVRKRYYDPGLHGLDWSLSRTRYRQAAADAAGASELYSALRRMLVELRDPHTRIFAPGENSDWRIQRTISVGFTVRQLAGEVIVTSVEKGSDAERLGVKVGDSVMKVNGDPAAKLIARSVTEQSTSSAATASWMATTRLFEGANDVLVEVLLRGADAKEKSLRIPRRLVVRQPQFHARMHDGEIGIVQFNVFTEETASKFVRALKDELEEAEALVIDLRENGGGETEAMTDIASMFLPPRIDLGRFIDRDGRVRLEPRTRDRFISTADELTPFSGPVVLLTDARTASASEVFAAALKVRERARVMGERTCGCVLGIRRRHTLPDGGVLDISELDYRTSTGKRLEGVGVDPDERISLTRRDILRGRDTALARAVQILKARS